MKALRLPTSHPPASHPRVSLYTRNNMRGTHSIYLRVLTFGMCMIPRSRYCFRLFCFPARTTIYDIGQERIIDRKVFEISCLAYSRCVTRINVFEVHDGKMLQIYFERCEIFTQERILYRKMIFVQLFSIVKLLHSGYFPVRHQLMTVKVGWPRENSWENNQAQKKHIHCTPLFKNRLHRRIIRTRK